MISKSVRVCALFGGMAVLASACGRDPAPSPIRSSRAPPSLSGASDDGQVTWGPWSTPLPNRSESPARLVMHLVAPKATDPAIDRALDDHYAWLAPKVRSNHRLFVFMPGTNQRPEMFKLVPEEAARLGYHAIGLMYQDDVALKGTCSRTTDPALCVELSRLEIIDGIHRSPIVTVTPANGIYNRLTKLLAHLGTAFPEEEWSDYLDDGVPRWDRIAIAGHSQGGGQAAMIAKLWPVARVVVFSSLPDTFAGHALPWLSPHATPSKRYFGIAHDRDATAPYASVLLTWSALGFTVFGPLVYAESNPPPYGGTHTLVTDLLPQEGSYQGMFPHGATSKDADTPLRSDGTPVLRDAWRYLLGAEEGEDDGDLMPARYGEWSPAVPVEGINSPANENHPAISKNGLSLYFTSDRKGLGALGGEDIWVSHRTCLDDTWGEPVNLGPNINSGGNDRAPNLTNDGRFLYFHSNGRGGYGGLDLFVSRRQDVDDDLGWEPAVNLGGVVNGPFDDAGPTIFEDEETGITTLYFTSNRPGGPGDFDVYASTRAARREGVWSRGPGARVERALPRHANCHSSRWPRDLPLL